MTQPETPPNQAQAQLWNAHAGQVWVEQNARLDRLFEPFVPPLLDAVQAAGASAVLDIGCGAGATTLAVAERLGAAGRCDGVDISAPLVAAARRRAVAAGLDNAGFAVADAQHHRFAPGGFDALISRFGVMFFDDPVAAFANLRRASRPGGALAFIAWRGAAENPFMTTAARAAAPWAPELLAPRDPEAPGQFAFADAARVQRILMESDWRDVEIAPLDVACAMSEDDLDAYVTSMGPVGMLLPSLEAERRGAVVAAVRAAFQPYVSAGVARFVAACWLVRARC